MLIVDLVCLWICHHLFPKHQLPIAAGGLSESVNNLVKAPASHNAWATESNT